MPPETTPPREEDDLRAVTLHARTIVTRAESAADSQRAVQATRSLSVITIIAVFATTSEQILRAANKPSGLQLAIATGRSVVEIKPRTREHYPLVSR